MKTESAECSMTPISAEQARSCLHISLADQVHSFWVSGFLSGADLELARVEDMLNGAAANGQLFLSDKLGGVMRHDILAWDSKYRQWTYLECVAEKVVQLRQALS